MQQPMYTQGVAGYGYGDYSGMSAGPFVNPVTDYADAQGSAYLPQFGTHDGGNGTFSTVWTIASVAGVGLGAYHGYKRNESVGWALLWGILGGLFPVIVIPVAFAQGLGKQKYKTVAVANKNARRRRLKRRKK